jgi:hypothetical protein
MIEMKLKDETMAQASFNYLDKEVYVKQSHVKPPEIL